MEQVTTIKVRKETTELLKAIAKQRGRRESMEQVILELVDRYVNENK
jgi:predicted DNA-binding protein